MKENVKLKIKIFLAVILFLAACTIPFIIINIINMQIEEEQKQNDSLVKKDLNILILSNFENSKEQIYTDKGEKSSIKVMYKKKVFNENNGYIHLISKTLDWSNASISLNENNNNWEDFDCINIKIYGNKSGNTFSIVFEDKLQENYNYQLVDNWSGWKEIVIPIKTFKSVQEWQPKGAIINQIIDYPISYIQFFSANNGDFDLYYDFIKITKY